MAFNVGASGGGNNPRFSNPQHHQVPRGRMAFPQQVGPQGGQPMPSGRYGYVHQQPHRPAQGFPEANFGVGYPVGHMAPNLQMQQAFNQQQQQKMMAQQQKLAEENQKKQEEVRRKRGFEIQQRKLQEFSRQGGNKNVGGNLSHLIGPLAQRGTSSSVSAPKPQAVSSSVFSRPGSSYSAHHPNIQPGQKFQPYGMHSHEFQQKQGQSSNVGDFGAFKEGPASGDAFSDFQEASPSVPGQIGNVSSSNAMQPNQGASCSTHSSPPVQSGISWQSTPQVPGTAGTSLGQGFSVGGQISSQTVQPPSWSGNMALTQSTSIISSAGSVSMVIGQRRRSDSQSSVSSTSSGCGPTGFQPIQGGPTVVLPASPGGQQGPGMLLQSPGQPNVQPGMHSQQHRDFTGQAVMPGSPITQQGGFQGQAVMVGMPNMQLQAQTVGDMQQQMRVPDQTEPAEDTKEMTPEILYGIHIPHWCSSGTNLPVVYKDVSEKVTTTNDAIDTTILYPVLLASGLSRDKLGQIWTHVNRETPGQLNQLELRMMLGLIALAQTGIKVERLTLEKLATCQTAPIPSFAEESLENKGRGWSFGEEHQKEGTLDMSTSQMGYEQSHEPSSTIPDVPINPNDRYSVFKSVAPNPPSAPVGDHIGGGQTGWSIMAPSAPSTSANVAPPPLKVQAQQDFGDLQSMDVPSSPEFQDFQGNSTVMGSDFGAFQESEISVSTTMNVLQSSTNTIVATASSLTSTFGHLGTASSSKLASSLEKFKLAAPPSQMNAVTTTIQQPPPMASSFGDFSSMLMGPSRVNESIVSDKPIAPADASDFAADFGGFSSATVSITTSVTSTTNTTCTTCSTSSSSTTSVTSAESVSQMKIAGDFASFPKITMPGSDAKKTKNGSLSAFPKIQMHFDQMASDIKSVTSAGIALKTITSTSTTPVPTTTTTTATTTTTMTKVSSQESSKQTKDKYDFLRDLDFETTGVFSLAQAARKKDDSFGNFAAFKDAVVESPEVDDFGDFSHFQSSVPSECDTAPKSKDIFGGFSSSLPHGNSSDHVNVANFETPQSTSLNELSKFELHPPASTVHSTDNFGDFANFQESTTPPSSGGLSDLNLIMPPPGSVPAVSSHSQTSDDFGDFANFESTKIPASISGFSSADVWSLNTGNSQSPSIAVSNGNSGGFGSFGGGSGGTISMPSSSSDASHTLISAVPLDSTQRYKVLSSDSEDVDRHANMWCRCLNSCLLTLATGALAIQKMTDPNIKQEVLKSKQGADYFAAIAEVYTVTQMIKVSVKKIASNNLKLQDIAQEIEGSWRSIANFLSGSNIDTNVADFSGHHVMANEDKRLACGVCLLNVDKTTPGNDCKTANVKLNYGGRQYHATCANFWCNRVDSILPSLLPVHSLI